LQSVGHIFQGKKKEYLLLPALFGLTLLSAKPLQTVLNADREADSGLLKVGVKEQMRRIHGGCVVPVVIARVLEHYVDIKLS
jgi:hypothetical protein